jgi:hypothetical protein
MLKTHEREERSIPFQEHLGPFFGIKFFDRLNETVKCRFKAQHLKTESGP